MKRSEVEPKSENRPTSCQSYGVSNKAQRREALKDIGEASKGGDSFVHRSYVNDESLVFDLCELKDEIINI